MRCFILVGALMRTALCYFVYSCLVFYLILSPAFAFHSVLSTQSSVLPSPASPGLVQIKRFMKNPHGQFHVLLVDHHRDLDLRSRDHLNIDALFSERAEHLAG